MMKPALVCFALVAVAPTSAANPAVASAALANCLNQTEAPETCLGVYAAPCADRLHKPRYAISAQAFYKAVARYTEAGEACHFDEMAAWAALLPSDFQSPPTACPGIETTFRGSRWGQPDPACLMSEQAKLALEFLNN